MTGTAFDITHAVQRSQYVLTELCAFVDDGINHVRSGDVSISRDAGIVSRHIQQFVHYELNFTQGSLVSWHRNDLVACCSCSGAAVEFRTDYTVNSNKCLKHTFAAQSCQAPALRPATGMRNDTEEVPRQSQRRKSLAARTSGWHEGE